MDYKEINCTLIESKDCISYITSARNRRFAENIKQLIDELPCGVPISLTVGLGHIEGISRNLEKYNFTESDSILSKYSYGNHSNFKDPEFPGRPDQN